MAFIQKTQNGSYRLGTLERFPFSATNPPTNAKGEVLVAVHRAMKAGRNYYEKARWIKLTVKTRPEAEAIKKDFEKTDEVGGKQRKANDHLFKDALAQILTLLSGKPNFDKHMAHRLRELEIFFGRKYLSNISKGEVLKFIEALEAKGDSGPTIKRKLNDLGALFRHFRDHDLFLGASPTSGIKVKESIYQAREITLEDWQQRDLLRGCYDPQATMHHQYALRTAKEQLAEKAEKTLKLRFDNSDAVQKRAFEVFKSKAAELSALGYPSSEFKELFAHLASQNHGRSLDAKTLYEIVLFELTYGLRKGEIIGVGHRVHGKTVQMGGLRVGHWDSAKKILTVMRTKKGKHGGVSRSNWIVTGRIAKVLDGRCKGKQPDDFIFDNQGKPILNFDKSFEAAVKFADVRVEIIDKKGMKKKIYPQFRDLRHVSCCNLLDSGLSVEEVARILGHSSTTMVQQVYGNRMKESTQQRQAQRTAEGMDRILGTI